MHKGLGRSAAVVLTILLVLTQPVMAGALDGRGDVIKEEVILTDALECPQLTLQSFESTSGGTGSLYSGLNARQKAVYTKLKDITWGQIISSSGRNVPVYVSGINGTVLSGTGIDGRFQATGASQQAYRNIQTDVNAAIVALRYDRPDLLWLDYSIGSYYQFTGSGGQYRIYEFGFSFTLPYGGQENAMRERMMAEARSIANEASRQPDMYSKVKKVHDMLAARSTYNWSAFYNTASGMAVKLSHSAYSAMLGGDAFEPVCDGYSKAFKIVMNLMDIPCAVPVGSDHMWNNVKMEDGLWYNVDLTWDDSGDPPAAGTAYFLVGSETVISGKSFKASHPEVDPFNESIASGARYPKKSTEAYKYIGEDYPRPTYPDVLRDSYAYESVEQVSKLGYFAGDESGHFNPAKKITRAEFATVMAAVMQEDIKQYYGRYSFPDVGTGLWYSGAVYWAKEKGVMAGSEGRFRPSDPISRQEMCTVLATAFGLEGSSGDPFPDDSSIADWAKKGVYACRAAGLVGGSSGGSFRPASSTLRRDAAIVFANYAKLIGVVPSGGQ